MFLYWAHLVYIHGTERLVTLSQIVVFVWEKWVSVTIQLCHWNWVNPHSRVILKKLIVSEILFRTLMLYILARSLLPEYLCLFFFYDSFPVLTSRLSRHLKISLSLSLSPRTSEWHIACSYHLPFEHVYFSSVFCPKMWMWQATVISQSLKTALICIIY
jgi:hypothetical protein